MFKKIIPILIVTFIPLFVFAEPLSGIKDIVIAIGRLIKLMIPIAYALAILFFFWGIAKFIYKAGDVKSKDEGKNIMIWGVIAIFVITSLMGLVNFINKSFGIENNTSSGSGNNNGGGSGDGLGNV